MRCSASNRNVTATSLIGAEPLLLLDPSIDPPGAAALAGSAATAAAAPVTSAAAPAPAATSVAIVAAAITAAAVRRPVSRAWRLPAAGIDVQPSHPLETHLSNGLLLQCRRLRAAYTR